METKQCRQCGEIKPLDQFRQYYGGRQGTYTMCRSCERINSRAKYLEKKDTRSKLEDLELNKIYQLYDAQRACGFRPPRREAGRKDTVVEDLDAMIKTYTDRANIVKQSPDVLDTTGTPPELLQWLSCELSHDPDYYLDDIYEALKAKYKPVLRIDSTTLLPIYDETHAAVLEAILNRFNDYEDTFYNKD